MKKVKYSLFGALIGLLISAGVFIFSLKYLWGLDFDSDLSQPGEFVYNLTFRILESPNLIFYLLILSGAIIGLIIGYYRDNNKADN